MDHIEEWTVVRDAAQTTCPPFTQVVLNTSFTGLSKQAPRLPPRARHDRYSLKFFVSVLGTVPSTKSLYKPNDLTAFLESRIHKGKVYTVRKQWICRDHNVATGNKYAHRLLRKRCEKRAQCGNIRLIQDSKPWKRTPLATVECRRDAPNSSSAAAHFCFLDIRVFFEAVGRVSYDGLDRVRFSLF